MSRTYSTANLSDLRLAAQAIAHDLPERCVILLSGPMAAGKTTFVRMIVEHMGGQAEASSPTFAIHQSYVTEKKLIDHFDLYRLETPEEVETSGLWDLLAQAEPRWIFIEWPERIDAQWISWPKTTCVFQVGAIRLT